MVYHKRKSIRRTSFRRPAYGKRRSSDRFRAYQKLRQGTRTAHRARITKQIGVPRVMPVKVRYRDTHFNMSTAGGTYQANNIFSGNSPYDPDATGVGVQPYQWDELTALYYQYNCFASKIKCTFYTTTLSTACPKITAVVFPYLSNAIPGAAELPDLKQRQGVRYINITNERSHDKNITVKNYNSSKRIFPTQTSRDGAFVVGTSLSPTERWYWVVMTDSADFAAATTIYMDVEIVYYCKLSKKVAFDQS